MCCSNNVLLQLAMRSTRALVSCRVDAALFVYITVHKLHTYMLYCRLIIDK